MHRCLNGVEHPETRAQLEVQRRHYGWDRLEFVRDTSHEYFSAATAFNQNLGSREVESLYRVAEDKWLLVRSIVSESTCESRDFRYSELVGDSTSRLCNHGYYDPLCRDYSTERDDRWGWLLPITNAEVETARFRCREFDFDVGHFAFCD